jgi:hypothetical protein
VLATLVVTLLLVGTSGGSIFSPGALKNRQRGKDSLGGVRSHADIESCSDCHVPPWSRETMADRCLNCHADVRKQIDSHGAMHGCLPEGTSCRGCHTEHKGARADITDLRHFDHDWTAFHLSGKHSTAECRSCHAEQCFKDTPQACVACHARAEPAYHKNSAVSFGAGCGDCHLASAWKDNAASRFNSTGNHDRTAFKLTGQHCAAECRSCHTTETFKETPQACAGCHGEPKVHMGKFGTECAHCHTTANWKSSSVAAAGGFDHDRTGFKLTGKHRSTDCKSCHQNNTFKDTPKDCNACHAKAEPVSHKASAAAFGTDCANCHSTNTWKDAAPSRFNHDLTAFKLTGKHVAADCRSCHKNETFKDTPQTCVACHASVEPQYHKTNVAAFGTACATCHSTNAWKDGAAPKFNHDKTAFKLTGKHVAVDCGQCHKNNTFKDTPQKCSSCHAEPKAHKYPYGNDCARCHTTNSFTGSTFKHTFPISHGQRRTGAMGDACKACHDKAEDLKTYTCYGCHQLAAMERRHPKVAKADLQFCAKCHKTVKGNRGQVGLDDPSCEAFVSCPMTPEPLSLHGTCPAGADDPPMGGSGCSRLSSASFDRLPGPPLDLSRRLSRAPESARLLQAEPTARTERLLPNRRQLLPDLLSARSDPRRSRVLG